MNNTKISVEERIRYKISVLIKENEILKSKIKDLHIENQELLDTFEECKRTLFYKIWKKFDLLRSGMSKLIH